MNRDPRVGQSASRLRSLGMAAVLGCVLLGACKRNQDVYTYDPQVDSIVPPASPGVDMSILDDQKTRPRPQLAPASAPAGAATAPATAPAGGSAPATAAAPEGAAAPTTAPAAPTAPGGTPPPPPVPE